MMLVDYNLNGNEEEIDLQMWPEFASKLDLSEKY